MLLALVLALACAAVAQELRSFHGRVLYVAGSSMGFAPDVGGSFDVDLSTIDQTAYAFLKSGDAVTVVGVVTPDGSKLIAVSITPDR
jgi:hypothetical protein